MVAGEERKRMSNPWDNTPSIWDGWEKQCFFRLDDREGRTCALGFIRAQYHQFNDCWWCTNETKDRLSRFEVELGGYDAPNCFNQIVMYNNLLQWTPEQFRELDRKVEWEYQMKKLDLIGSHTVAPEEMVNG